MEKSEGLFCFNDLKFLKLSGWLDRNTMTKDEVKAQLKAKGQFDTNTRNELWTVAFKLYYEATKNKLGMSCGSCYNKVRNWLNS